eukprot:6176-Heterococcus_DN1.PRE.2
MPRCNMCERKPLVLFIYTNGQVVHTLSAHTQTAWLMFPLITAACATTFFETAVTNGGGAFGLTGSAFNFNKVIVRGCVAGDRGGAIATLGDLSVIASALNNCTVCAAATTAATAAAATAAAIGAATTAVADAVVSQRMFSMMLCHALHSAFTDHADYQL